MNQKRWFSGDSHVHFLGERGAHREAQGEDLNVVNLLASQWGHLFTNTEDFIGGPPKPICIRACEELRSMIDVTRSSFHS